MGNKLQNKNNKGKNYCINVNHPNNIFLSDKRNNLFSPSSMKKVELSPALFDYKYVIGRGGFGRVYKVVFKQTNTPFALKQISKIKIIDKKTEKCIKNERDILAQINHPFIVNLHFTFQDKDYLYFVLDLLPGGDLRYHLSQNHRFTEEQTKFFVGCLILGIEYLHSNGVIHRDIKPENLVLDENGYMRVTDFGIAKMYKKEEINETSGTPGYMGPEIFKGQNLTFAVDYFALGVLTYEFMKGLRPYIGKNKRELREKILSEQIHISKDDLPAGWSFDVVDFVIKLLQKCPANRLGLRSTKEVKEHSWFKGFPWEDVYHKKIVAPFIPLQKDNFDKNYCEGVDHEDLEAKVKYKDFLKEVRMLPNFDFYRLETGLRFKNKIGENFIRKKFINPHENIKNINKIKENPPEEEKKFVNEDCQSIKMHNKFVMAKNKAFSSSNSLLIREYKNCNMSLDLIV